MGPKDVIRSLIGSNDFVLNAYVADFSDADLLVRPAPGANHIAWQLGHLILAEQGLLKSIPNATPIELPAGWEVQYSAESSHKEPSAGFQTKERYLELYRQSRSNLMKVLEAYPEAELDRPTPGRMAQISPKIGDLFVLIANHPMMHAGQFVVLRRKLGKPIVI